MFEIKTILEKFKHIKNPSLEKENIAQKINNFLKLSLNKDNINIKNGDIKIINVSPIIRQIVFLKQQELVDYLNKENFSFVIKKVY